MKLKFKRNFLLLPTVLLGTILTAACTDNEQTTSNKLKINTANSDNKPADKTQDTNKQTTDTGPQKGIKNKSSEDTVTMNEQSSDANPNKETAEKINSDSSTTSPPQAGKPGVQTNGDTTHENQMMTNMGEEPNKTMTPTKEGKGDTTGEGMTHSPTGGAGKEASTDGSEGDSGDGESKPVAPDGGVKVPMKDQGNTADTQA